MKYGIIQQKITFIVFNTASPSYNYLQCLHLKKFIEKKILFVFRNLSNERIDNKRLFIESIIIFVASKYEINFIFMRIIL